MQTVMLCSYRGNKLLTKVSMISDDAPPLIVNP